jgi:hypothetical protein
MTRGLDDWNYFIAIGVSGYSVIAVIQRGTPMGHGAKKVGTLIGWGAPPLKSYGALEPSLLDHSPRTIMGKKDSHYRLFQSL